MTTRSRSERAKLAYTLKSPQRKEFFRVWDARPQGQSMREFCAIHKAEQWCPSHSHGYRWLKEREKIIKEGLGSPTRRLPPQKPQGRPKKVTSHVLEAMAEGQEPRAQFIKEHLAHSGVCKSTLYRHWKEQEQRQHDQITAPPQLSTGQRTSNISAEWQDQSSGPSTRPETARTIVDYASSFTDRQESSMPSNQDTLVAASGSASGSRRRQPAKRPEYTTVACSACRRQKTKCDGGRPACKRCSKRKSDCKYDHEPGEGRLAVLKRKFDALEAQSVDALELLENLRTAPYEDALQLFAQIRSQEVPFTMQASRALEGTTTTMLYDQGLPRPSSGIETSGVDTQNTSFPVGAPAEGDDATTAYPYPDGITESSSWTINPYAC